MRAEVERIRGAPADEPSISRLRPQSKSQPDPGDDLHARTIFAACFVDDPPPRDGPAVLGFDFGEAVSATAACAIWPLTGRRRNVDGVWRRAKPLAERQRRDSRPTSRWKRAASCRPIAAGSSGPTPSWRTYSRISPALASRRPAPIATRTREARDFLDRAAVRWPIQFRRVGAGKDGGRDVRAFQRLVMQGRFALADNLALATAIVKSTLRRDGNGNPGLDRATSRGRIDVLSAAVIAAGLAEAAFDRPARRRRRFALAG